MLLEKIALPETHSFSSFFLDYITGKDALKDFYGNSPSPESFGSQIDLKSTFPQANRNILANVLERQYGSIDRPHAVTSNISLLKSADTFTITTGHQLNIFTGPLYFIFKIVTAINTCKELRKRYPGKNFVPVYWMASEDHDFEEISYFKLYGKKYTWHTDQRGAVGRFKPASLASVLKDVPGDTSLFQTAYLKNATLSDAVRYYVNALFGEEGIVVIDADDHDLKQLLRPVMSGDIFNHITASLVNSDTEKLKALGYHTQVNARDINFFYLDDNIRDRVEKDGEGFTVINQQIKFNENELQKLIEQSPERLSPNVALRPLYQEIILPNLAYVGGPSELVYWLQLKSLFTHYAIPFPILMPRNFGMIIDAPLARKLDKTGLNPVDFFEQKNFLFNHWTLQNTNHDLTVSSAIKSFSELFEKIKVQAGLIDTTLVAHVDAKAKQAVHQIEVIGHKMLRAEKRRSADKLRQVEEIKDALFPGGNLQERTDNFLNFFQTNPSLISDLLKSFDPFDYKMHVLKYDDEK